MAKDEMEQITEDRWDQDIWGVEHEDVDHNYKVPKLVFYFGQKVRLSSVLGLRESRLMEIGSLGGRPYSRCFDSCQRTGRGRDKELEANYDD
jgi:hypothetical protein